MPPLLCPNEGEVKLLSELTANGENHLLKLYKNDYTPTETDTLASYTICDFDGYVDKTLTRGNGGSNWQTPTSETPTGSSPWSAEAAAARSVYGTAAQSWTCTGTGNTIYGYLLVGATSGKVIVAERFASPRTINNGDSISVWPELGLV